MSCAPAITPHPCQFSATHAHQLLLGSSPNHILLEEVWSNTILKPTIKNFIVKRVWFEALFKWVSNSWNGLGCYTWVSPTVHSRTQRVDPLMLKFSCSLITTLQCFLFIIINVINWLIDGWMAHWTASSYFSTGEDPLSYFFVVRYLLHGGDHLHNSGQEEIEKHNKQTKKKFG
jgi:hypothetical protein